MIMGLALLLGCGLFVMFGTAFTLDWWRESKKGLAATAGLLVLGVLSFGIILPFVLGKPLYESYVEQQKQEILQKYQDGEEADAKILETEWREMQGEGRRVRRGGFLVRPASFLGNSIWFGLQEEARYLANMFGSPATAQGPTQSRREPSQDVFSISGTPGYLSDSQAEAVLRRSDLTLRQVQCFSLFGSLNDDMIELVDDKKLEAVLQDIGSNLIDFARLVQDGRLDGDLSKLANESVPMNFYIDGQHSMGNPDFAAGWTFELIKSEKFEAVRRYGILDLSDDTVTSEMVGVQVPIDQWEERASHEFSRLNCAAAFNGELLSEGEFRK